MPVHFKGLILLWVFWK